jgi:hypothetical protein
MSGYSFWAFTPQTRAQRHRRLRKLADEVHIGAAVHKARGARS